MDVDNMGETPDRISELPNSVLLCILSLIPTKQAVQTSILSRRWRYIWTSMPALEFDDNQFPFLWVKHANENTGFVNFVDMVMRSHDISDIQRLRLTSFFICDASRVNSWIDVAIKHNVQELHIDTSKSSLQCSDGLFTSESLVYLKLSLYLSFIDLPDSICLSRLTTLHLDSVVFKENGLIPKLISSCPVLENLIMTRCGWGWKWTVVEISSPTVRNFTLDGSCWGVGADDYESDRTFKISMPNLISLAYIDFIALDYFIDNLSSLVDAYIDVKIGNSYWSEMYESSGYRVTNLLRGVSNASCLTLSHSTLELLSDARDLLELLPTFHNLTKLVLTSGRSEMHFIVIACLLKRCPILESLEIEIEPSPIYEYQYYSEEGQEVEGLLLDHLKEVKIRCFGRTKDELEFVNLLVGSPSQTKRLIILEEEDVEKRTEISICT